MSSIGDESMVEIRERLDEARRLDRGGNLVVFCIEKTIYGSRDWYERNECPKGFSRQLRYLIGKSSG